MKENCYEFLSKAINSKPGIVYNNSQGALLKIFYHNTSNIRLIPFHLFLLCVLSFANRDS